MTEAAPVIMTDPARELVEFCEALYATDAAEARGQDHLASKFGIVAWGPEFFQIIYTVSERINLLTDIIESLEIDTDYRNEMVAHVRDILVAFSGPTLRNPWEAHGRQHIGPLNTQPLKAISGLVRTKVRYKKLSLDERNNIIIMSRQLKEWLCDHQLSEHDFIRQSIIDGLQQFEFRLQRLEWLGSGYALESLRSVIAAYMMLERVSLPTDVDPNFKAILLRVENFTKNVYNSIKDVRDSVEVGDFILRAYGAGSLWLNAQPTVAGFLGGN